MERQAARYESFVFVTGIYKFIRAHIRNFKPGAKLLSFPFNKSNVMDTQKYGCPSPKR